MRERVVGDAAGARIVTRRELRALFADKQARVMVILFTLAFPLALASSAGRTPGNVLAVFSQVMIFPHLGAFSAAVASLVGEREHGTIGPLLATPLSNASIFFGKLGGAFLPGIVMSSVSSVLFLLVAPQRTKDVLADVPVRFLLESFLLAQVSGMLFAVSGVIVGARAKTIRGGQMVAGLIFAPMMIGIAFIGTMLVTHEGTALAIVGAMVVFIVVGVRLGARLWRREEVLTRQV